MEQATRNYLTLVNDSIEEAGDDLASFAVDGSDFTTQTDAMMLRFKKWVNRAWRDIQQESLDWEWMSEQAVVNITPGIMFYSPHIIDWTVDEINPVTIYDVDGTSMITPLSASNLHNLTGIYTHLENFGYVDVKYPDYSFTNQHTLDFGMKAGGEYFLTTLPPENGEIALVSGMVWASLSPVEPTILQVGTFPAHLVTPAAGTTIVRLHIATATSADSSTVTAHNTYDVSGITRDSTGTPATEVMIISLVEPDFTAFLSDYTTLMQSPDEDNEVITLFAEDSDGNFYGGNVKNIRDSNGDWAYNTCLKFQKESITLTEAGVTSSIQEYGGFTATPGDALVHCHFADNFLTSSAGLTFSIDATVTDVVPGSGSDIDEITLELTNDLDSSDINSSNLYAINVITAALSTDFSGTIDEDAGATSGLQLLYENSSNLLVEATYSVSVVPSISWKNYTHSWKSFDWSEELGDDDFVEEVREINQSTFRIIAHDDPAISSELPLQFMPWEMFQNKFDFASAVPSMPRIVTEDNTGRWRFYPPPNRPYTILFDYVREPRALSAATDVPVGLPEEYTDLIMWRAIAYYGEYDEQPSVAMRAWKNYKTLLMKFEMQTREKFHFKSAYSWSSRTLGL